MSRSDENLFDSSRPYSAFETRDTFFLPREVGEVTSGEVTGHTLSQSEPCEWVSGLNGGVFLSRFHNPTRVSSDRIYNRSTVRVEEKRALDELPVFTCQQFDREVDRKTFNTSEGQLRNFRQLQDPLSVFVCLKVSHQTSYLTSTNSVCIPVESQVN